MVHHKKGLLGFEITDLDVDILFSALERLQGLLVCFKAAALEFVLIRQQSKKVASSQSP